MLSMESKNGSIVFQDGERTTEPMSSEQAIQYLRGNNEQKTP